MCRCPMSDIIIGLTLVVRYWVRYQIHTGWLMIVTHYCHIFVILEQIAVCAAYT